MSDQIKCPNCKTIIKISDALSQQAKDEIAKAHQQELKNLELRIKQQEEDLETSKKKIVRQYEQKEKDLVEKQKKEIEEKELEIKKQAWAKAQEKAQEKFSLELKDLQEQSQESKRLKKQMEEEILAERKKARQLEEEARKAKVESDKQIEAEKNKARAEAEIEAQKKADEDYRKIIAEMEKKQKDTEKALEEARRKAQQGSQQNQGEVLELDLEQNLKTAFIYDVIEPIGKGIVGADICQRVQSKSGGNCGTILFEIKQTKNWTEGWVAKLKDDLRKVKANIPVLVSTVLPKDIDGFGFYQGIWVSSPKHVIALVIALRKNLIEVAYERSALAGRGKKSDLLFDYVASHEFRQRVEALVEVYHDMQGQINKERIAFEKSWSQRQKQVQRLLENTAGIYGDMQGLVGSSLGEIKGLEMGEENEKLESGQETMF